MSYLYLKQQPAVNKTIKRIPKEVHSASPKSKAKKKLALVLFAAGLFLLMSAIYPILSFSFKYSTNLNQVLSPLSNRFYNQDTILGQETDYTHLDNWFISKTNQSSVNSADTPQTNLSYFLSVPKLKIEQALVVVGSEDLKKSLIHYQNTALPGQLGNGVIFGHSVLPQFFNPKSYLTIFSTLFKLEQGDEIFVKYDNIDYRYLVEQMYEVSPSDLTVLEQRFDGRYLTIITCSPPGTYLRRLVVKARIVDI